MNRWTRLAAWIIPAVAFVHACGGSVATDSTSGNTNWLKYCDRQADCGEGLSCLCNTCQETCSQNADCGLAGFGSRCALPSDETRCDDAPTATRLCVKNCDVSADCERDDLVCSAGACAVREARDGGGVDSSSPRDSAPIDDLPQPTNDRDATMTQPDATPPDNDIPDGSSMIDDSPDSPLTSGPGYGIACANNGNMGPGYFDCSVTFDADGNMVAYESADGDHLGLGNGLISDTGSNGVVAWGKWIGGPMLGSLYGRTPTSYDFPNGLHYVVGKLATTLPAGPAVYQQWGGTEPGIDTSASIEPRTALVNYVQFAVDYSSGKFGLEMRVTPEGEDPVTFETTGGIADVSDSEGILNNKLFSIQLAEEPHALFLGGHIVDNGEALALSYRVRHDKLIPVSGFLDGGAPKTRTERRSIYGVVGLARTE